MRHGDTTTTPSLCWTSSEAIGRPAALQLIFWPARQPPPHPWPLFPMNRGDDGRFSDESTGRRRTHEATGRVGAFPSARHARAGRRRPRIRLGESDKAVSVPCKPFRGITKKASPLVNAQPFRKTACFGWFLKVPLSRVLTSGSRFRILFGELIDFRRNLSGRVNTRSRGPSGYSVAVDTSSMVSLGTNVALPAGNPSNDENAVQR